MSLSPARLHAPAAASDRAWYVPPNWLKWVAIPVQLAWIAAVLSSSILRHDLRLAGLAFVVLDVGAFCGSAAGALAPRHRPRDFSPLDKNAAEHPVVLSPAIGRADRARWAMGTMALLAERQRGTRLSAEPVIQLVRVGKLGVELLLAAALEDSPASFHSTAGGLVWQLDRGIEFAALPAEDSATTMQLVELGDDEDGTYFARLDPERPPYCDQPFGGPLTTSAADLLLVEEPGGSVVVEPLGLRLRRVPGAQVTHSAPIPAEPESAQRVPEDIDSTREGALGSAGSVLPGSPVEVRILRERPDLIGGLLALPSPAAVDFVAYLATHGYRVSSARLRDALGADRGGVSRSGKTIWNAAGAARRALGAARVPAAAGNELYLLDEKVGCDWTRFKALAASARDVDAEEQCSVLTEALALVEGVPALASRRFAWLDAEGILAEITTEVLEVARDLAALALAGEDPRLAAWAIAKGRQMLPNDEALSRLEARLGGEEPNPDLPTRSAR